MNDEIDALQFDMNHSAMNLVRENFRLCDDALAFRLGEEFPEATDEQIEEAITVGHSLAHEARRLTWPEIAARLAKKREA